MKLFEGVNYFNNYNFFCKIFDFDSFLLATQTIIYNEKYFFLFERDKFR